MRPFDSTKRLLSPALIFFAVGCGEGATIDTAKLSKPHASPIAGSWYPGDAKALGAMIDEFLAAVEAPEETDAIAFVSPHAGYSYSGATAAHVYKAIAKRKPSRVIVIGPSHSVGFRGVSIGDFDCYETPLGRVAVDLETIKALRQCPLVKQNAQAHTREHSVDIQVPFLQRALAKDSFTIVPIVAGQLEKGDLDTLAEALRRVLDDNTVIVASSDFTHYGAAFQFMPFDLDDKTRANIEKLDMGAIDALKEVDREAFIEYKARTGATICGHTPIALMISVLPDGAAGTLLKYAVSGDRDRDYAHSVSYAAMAFSTPDGSWQTADEGDMTLTKEEKATLLRIARDTLEQHVREGKNPSPDAKTYDLTEKLNMTCGAFVTLHKNGDLRGCIGHIVGRMSMAETVATNAVNAASNDYRFNKVTPAELDSIDIELSVLSPMREVDGYEDIVIGKHGVLLKQGSAQAVFLPQVAPEQGWDRDTTLSHLAQKAGLSANSWKDRKTRFEVFTAIVFGEKQH